MANRRLIESELPPVGYASQEGLGGYTGRGGGLHRQGRRATQGRGGCFTVGVSGVGRREKRSCGKDWARLMVGVNLFP